MTTVRSIEKQWLRIRRLQWFYKRRMVATWAFGCITIFNITNQNAFHFKLGFGFISIEVAVFLLLFMGFKANRELLKVMCPDCGERLFARIPPKHLGEEYLDQSSDSCANCGVRISSRAL